MHQSIPEYFPQHGFEALVCLLSSFPLQFVSESRPVTTCGSDIRIISVSKDAAPTNCILFEIKESMKWHSVNDLAEDTDLPATRDVNNFKERWRFLVAMLGI